MSSSLLFKKVDSGNYITAKRQLAIYNSTPAAPLVKKNGFMYNKNFRFIPENPITDTSNCLIAVQNYDLRQAYSNGKSYSAIVCAPPAE
jgi:hypothetical protein